MEKQFWDDCHLRLGPRFPRRRVDMQIHSITASQKRAASEQPAVSVKVTNKYRCDYKVV